MLCRRLTGALEAWARWEQFIGRQECCQIKVPELAITRMYAVAVHTFCNMLLPLPALGKI
jgi:hypothetical protein